MANRRQRRAAAQACHAAETHAPQRATHTVQPHHATCNIQHARCKMGSNGSGAAECARACARAGVLRVLLLLAGITQRALYECICHLLPMPTARRLRAVPRPSAEPSRALNHGETESEGRCEHAQGAFEVCVHCYRHTAAVGLHGPDLPVANGSVQPRRVERLGFHRDCAKPASAEGSVGHRLCDTVGYSLRRRPCSTMRCHVHLSLSAQQRCMHVGWEPVPGASASRGRGLSSPS